MINYTSGTAFVVSGIALMLAALPASATSPPLKPFPLGRATGSINISVSYQFFLTGNTQSVADQTALVDQGRRHLYMLLAKECAVLLETIASDCIMNRANVNARMRQGQGSRNRDGVRVSGSATYKIKLKANSQTAAE